MKKTPGAIYRPLVREAASLTWKRKPLWVFSFFAGLLSTGGVMEILTRTFRQMETTENTLWQLFSGKTLGLEMIGHGIREINLLGPGHVTLMGSIFIVLVLVVLMVAVRSQAALILGISEKQGKTFWELWSRGSKSFWQILFLNLFSRVAQGIIVLVTSLPLLLFLTQSDLTNALIFFFLFLLFFPLTIAIAVVSTLALIDIVRRRVSVFEAIHTASAMFARHWLVTFELGVVLFAMVTSATVLFVVILVLLTVPFSVVMTLVFASGFSPLFLAVIALGILFFFICFFAFAGAMACFQHTAWVLFYQRAIHGVRRHGLIAKLERLWQMV